MKRRSPPRAIRSRATAPARRGCRTSGYQAKVLATPNAEVIVAQLDEDDVLMLIRQHLRDLPVVLPEGASHTNHLGLRKDGVDQGRVLEVTTTCKNGRLQTIAHDPHEPIPVFS